ncbi:methylamine dehydrogenase heavy chain [Sphingobium sp. OAS761]|uniref:amine dehydrogenase large subunit n=1 Tax=Sphingobium sp. OAS761 TaxID=2817901 RepID=UPI00209C9295|nr:amine dehydrogenase large subunit [Sphingobium sp. OAS761]MCP1469508.1 methylamine dehydrogenase heavy chain [Sphingobium sp. OAS761]
MSRTVRSIFAAGLAIVFATAAAAAQTPPPAEVEAEISDTMTLPSPVPTWFFVDGGWDMPGTSIFDGETGKMKGMVETRRLADMAIDPNGRYYYVSETIWSKVDRGTRQDMVSVYDSKTLNLVTEIALPGRILIGSRKNNFIVSDDGRFGYIYDFSPTSAVNVVDLSKRKFVTAVELPGCASLIPNPGVGFSALCSDGSLATVAVRGAKADITHTAPFFAASDDPIFDNFAYDRAKKESVFLTYTGQIYTAKIGPTPTVSAPFSIQAAAGIRPGETKPLELNWYPGGRQPLALHRATGQLFVLMHMGEYWSHKASGSELWQVDLATQKVVKRFVLKEAMNNVEVTQTDKPLLFLNDEKGDGVILDAATGEEKHKIENAGGGIISVPAS